MFLKKGNIVALDTSLPIWDHFFTVAPLVVIGTREGEHYDLAPKHMATPLGLENYFGFVCTPRHSTYRNIEKEACFTVSFPLPDQVVLAGLAASPRCGGDIRQKPVVESLPHFRAPKLDAPFMEKAYLYLECRHMKTVDGFGQYSLICGEITGAYVNRDYLRVSEQDEQELVYQAPLLAYLASGRFSTIRESFSFPFPKDVKV